MKNIFKKEEKSLLKNGKISKHKNKFKKADEQRKT